MSNKTSVLAQQKSKIKTDYTALNVCIVGAPKCGKSTFASQLGEGVYFAATEPGHHFLEVFKSDINCWKDFEVLVNALTTEKHDFKHLVIDVVDKLHGYAQDEICSRNKVKEIADIPFGGGYTASKRLLMNDLERINRAGIGLTFITHPKDKEVKKDNITWTAVGTSLANSIENQILGMCDLILFAYMDKENKRMIRTKPTRYVQCAGDRSNLLPEHMPLDPKLVMEYLNGTKKV